jgi:hypothetical protein
LDNHLDNITIGCARSQCKTIKPVPAFPRAASIEPCQIFREAGKIAYRPAKILAPDLLQSGKAAQVILHVAWRSQILKPLFDTGQCHRFLLVLIFKGADDRIGRKKRRSGRQWICRPYFHDYRLR